MNPLVVALDVADSDHALKLVEQLHGLVGMFKVGKQLFTAAGPQIVHRITEVGERVFLDLKFHDIPNTVASAGVEAARMGVTIFNVHALGGREMMERTSKAIHDVAGREKLMPPLVLGVTILTSHDQASLVEIGIDRPLEEEVVALAMLSESAGLDGVVASPREIGPIRTAVRRKDFVILVPGVRPAGADHHDQARVMTPAQAIEAGATFIVVGRPIIADNDPRAAAQRILEEIEQTAVRNV
jgi:orotidine-5'-phosphate decarboxylase